MNKTIVFLMGFQAVLLQITLLRELLAVFSGNELDLGITIAVWLFGAGSGSFTGRSTRHEKTLTYIVAGIMALSLPTYMAIHMIRPLAGAGPGEVLSLPITLGASAIVLTPLCFLIGMQFPQAVSWMGGAAALTYGLEAGGFFLGGLTFTMFLAGRITPEKLIIIVSVVSGLFVFIINKNRKVGIIVLIIFTIALMVGLYGSNRHLDAIKVEKTIYSRYGRIDLLKIQNQYTILSNGRYQYSYPDAQAEELASHVTMSLHPLPSRVLMIGGSPAAVRELLKYPVKSIDLVEIDPEMVRLSFELLGDEDRLRLKDRRLKVINEDPRRYVKNAGTERFDLIIMNLPEPATAAINRLYTVEFFQEARSTMRFGGVLAVTLPSSFGYIGRQVQRANGTIHATLQAVFRHVEPSSEEYGLFAASDQPIETEPAKLRERFRSKMVQTSIFRPELMDDMFDTRRREAVRSRLKEVDSINRDNRPVAYLYNLLVWAELQGVRSPSALVSIGKYSIVFLIALAAGASAMLWKKRGLIPYSIFLSGGITMTFFMTIILAFQAAFGYVYAAIGLITAVFMAGMAGGAIVLRNCSDPLPVLRKLQGGMILLLLLSPLLLRGELTCYAAVFLAGAAGGGEFAAASKAMVSGGTDVAGKLYALDLAGSFFGALLCSLVLVPLFGMFATTFFLAVIKLSSLVPLYSLGHENA